MKFAYAAVIATAFLLVACDVRRRHFQKLKERITRKSYPVKKLNVRTVLTEMASV